MTDTVHQLIKKAREAKKWSHQRVADEVSKAMKLAKHLSWQTVQQWEKTTAPTRKKWPYVAQVLGIDSKQYAATAPEPPDDELGELRELWPFVPQETREELLMAAMQAATPALAKGQSIHKRIMARRADNKRVAERLGTPKKHQNTK